jgi:hypothetical protein
MDASDVLDSMTPDAISRERFDASSVCSSTVWPHCTTDELRRHHQLSPTPERNRLSYQGSVESAARTDRAHIAI